ncbi:MAG: MarR family winged helix-turn-helix transcriptional regulator [Dermatophilaceae bacterium]
MGTSPRPDLAAMLGPFGRALIGMERPILEANGLSMWGYAVLLALGEEPVRTQAAVAEMIGADKTRIIADLDTLQDRGMIAREPDPADRRVRMVSITAKGRRTRHRVQTAIQRREELMLAQFSAADRNAFLRVARTLADQARAGELPHPGPAPEK